MIDSAERFNIDENFDFSQSIWARAILDTVKIEINGLCLNMERALKEVESIEELETFAEKLSVEYKKLLTFHKHVINLGMRHIKDGKYVL